VRLPAETASKRTLMVPTLRGIGGVAGTDFEGSAVTRTTDDGVQYERITYYPSTPSFSKVDI